CSHCLIPKLPTSAKEPAIASTDIEEFAARLETADERSPAFPHRRARWFFLLPGREGATSIIGAHNLRLCRARVAKVQITTRALRYLGCNRAQAGCVAAGTVIHGIEGE